MSIESDYEKVCAEAITSVEDYLANDMVADMYEELQEAQTAVDDAWDTVKSRKANRMCRAAWHACLAAKNDEQGIARMYVAEYWFNV